MAIVMMVADLATINYALAGMVMRMMVMLILMMIMMIAIIDVMMAMMKMAVKVFFVSSGVLILA